MIAPNRIEDNESQPVKERSGHTQLSGAEQLDLYRSDLGNRASSPTFDLPPMVIVTAAVVGGLALGWFVKRSSFFR